jgi:hypothetical protein
MKKRTKLLFLFLTIGIFLNISCKKDCECEKRIVFQSGPEKGKDAYIETWPFENYNNRNFGTHPEFQASSWTSGGTPLVVRCLIDFDFKKIPDYVHIINADLFLYTVDDSENGPGHSKLQGSNEFLLQRIISDWDELSVTWNTQPDITDENQIWVEASDSTMQDYKINVTTLIQEIVDSPLTRYGLMLRLVNEDSYRRILFASSDYPNPSKHPKLIVEYR